MKYSRKTLVLLMMATLALAVRLAAVEHPVKLEKDADCASCHEDKAKGKAVHSAIAMGCTSCHDVKTAGETTTVELNAPKEQLCFSCHDKSKDEVQHAPYAKGQCTTCHDPHTSDFPKQVLAPVNQQCLTCHADRPVKGDTVTLLKTQTMPASEFAEIPKIVPTPLAKYGHPWVTHPMTDIPDPLRGGEKMSCLSCHNPHSSPIEKLAQQTKPGQDLCETCHDAVHKKHTDQNAAAIATQEQQRTDALKKMDKQAPLYQKPGDPKP